MYSSIFFIEVLHNEELRVNFSNFNNNNNNNNDNNNTTTNNLSPLVLVLVLIPLSLILRKVKRAYEFSESKEKINHLLFMDDLKLYSRSEKGLDSLVQTVCVFSEDTGMEFGIEKCAMLVMEKEKIVKSVIIELPDGKVIKLLQEDESYKDLGILEADKVLEEKMS